MRYEVLGPLRVSAADGPVPMSGRRTVAAVCWLVLNANQAVSVESLAAQVWQQPNAGAKARLLLRTLAVTLPAGALELGAQVRLVVPDGGVDAWRFERLVSEARGQLRGGDLARAQANLDAALELWRGEPYRELDRAPEAVGEIDRLSELHLAAIEERTSLRLRGAVDYTLVAELRALTALHPERARMRRQLALALYRTDRQIDALETLRLAGRELGDGDGRIAQLQAAMLARDAALSTGELAG